MPEKIYFRPEQWPAEGEEDGSTRRILFWIAVACLVGALIGAAESRQESHGRNAAQSSALYAMAPAQFFALPESGRAITPGTLDRTLLSAALFHATNQRRQLSGVNPLRHDGRLDAAAAVQADSMARMGYLSHDNPYRPKSRTPLERARQSGFAARYLAENVAFTFAIQYQPGRKVYPVEAPQGTKFSYQPGGAPIPRQTYRSLSASLLDQWMASPKHRENILAAEPDSFGSACAERLEKKGMDRFYCVQLFASQK